MKRVTKDIIIFCVVFLTAVILVGNINFTGNVVWNDIPLDNCSDAKIGTYWDSIFTKSYGSGVTIEKSNQGDGYCDKFVAYNYSKGSLYVLYSDIWNNTWNVTEVYSSNYRILKAIDTYALYFNTTDEFMSSFYPLNIDDKMMALAVLGNTNPENLTNWSLSTEALLNGNFSLHYQNGITSGIYWNDNDNWEFSNSTLNVGVSSAADIYTVLKNDSAISTYHSINYYDPTYYVNYTGPIPSFTNDTNTSWVYMFNWTDYFNFSADNNLTIDFSADINNTDGKYINATIGADGNVSFKANESFVGRRTFQLVLVSPSGTNTSSNPFNVTFNTEPEQLQDIEDFHIVNGTTESIDLDDYFYDEDGQTLNYSIHSSVLSIDVDITGSTLEIGLGENFGDFEYLKIDVFDGFSSITSNGFHIYETSTSGDEDNPAPAVDDSNDTQTLVEDGETIQGEDGGPKTEISSNNINQISESSDPKKVLRTVLYGFLGLIVLAIIAILVMIFLKSKGKGKSAPKKPTVAAPMRPRIQTNSRPPLRQVISNRGPIPRSRPPANSRYRR